MMAEETIQIELSHKLAEDMLKDWYKHEAADAQLALGHIVEAIEETEEFDDLIDGLKKKK